MSDLAPFVASVLRDKTVEELKEENDRLRESLRQTREVTVTGGYHGHKVYARGHLDAGENVDDTYWVVDLEQSSELLLAELEDERIEIRVGGIVKQTLSRSEHCGDILGYSYVASTRRGELNLWFPGRSWLDVEVSPISEAALADLMGEDQAFLDDILRLDQSLPISLSLKIKKVWFLGRTVSGAVDYSEDFEV